jgi:hypothetical protein
MVALNLVNPNLGRYEASPYKNVGFCVLNDLYSSP